MPSDTPRDSIKLPKDETSLVGHARDIIDQCKVSVPARAMYCRLMSAIMETGRPDGNGPRAQINMLYSVIDKIAALLFSPAEMRFAISFEDEYPENVLVRGRKAAELVTNHWKRRGVDMLFARAVFWALEYGCMVLKQYPANPSQPANIRASLVPPWQFGVLNESRLELDAQPAMVETIQMTLPEVWRRIYWRPDAKTLFERIKQHANKGQVEDSFDSTFNHPVLSTSQLQTGNVGMTRPLPGGIVQLGGSPNQYMIGTQVAADLVKMHELWLWQGTDYATIQIIDPDILLTSTTQDNILVPGATDSGLHPYSVIRPNESGNFWGRSELADIIEPQGTLAIQADDVQRLWGLQIDKIIATTGDGITDEVYAELRQSGWQTNKVLRAGMGEEIKDLTPPFPENAIPMLEFQMRVIEKLAGLDNVLSGRGEPGVRAGNHGGMLMRTASPPLRDRSLLLERQAAAAGDLTLSLMEAKDDRIWHTDPDREEASAFRLGDLPDDRFVEVDSHSSSPIWLDDQLQAVNFAMAHGLLDPEDAIDYMPLANKDLLKRKLRDKEKQQQHILQQLMQVDPKEAAKLLAGGKKK